MPVERRCKLPHVIQLSGFDHNDRKALGEAITAMGGEYIDSSFFQMSCTHVVSAEPTKNEKFLCGCAAGKWVVSREFIGDSAKSRKWMDEERYEWSSQKLPRGIVVVEDLVKLQSAPKRWRLSEQRPFDGWRVCLTVKEQKKRDAYKRLVEAGGGLVYDTAVTIGLTHIFVDKDEDQSLDKSQLRNNIPILPVECIRKFLLQDQPFSCKTVVNNHDSRESSVGVVLSQEDTNGHSTSFDIPLTAVIPVEISLDHSTSDKLNGRVWEIVGNLIEERQITFLFDGLSSLCSCGMPPADILHTLLIDVLLDASSVDIANKVCVLLRKMLGSSPPWLSTANRQVYIDSLASCPSRVNKDNVTSSAWNMLCDVVRVLLPAGDRPVSGTVLGATKLFEFLFSLLTQDYIRTEREHPDQLRDTILCQLVWPAGHCTGINCRIRELFVLTMDTAASSEHNTSLKLTVNMLCQLIAYVSQYCHLNDKKNCSQGVTPCSDSVVAELAITIASSSHQLLHSALRLVLESLQPAWLVFKVCQTVLDRFVSLLEKDKKKTDLQKVVTNHMWLIPSWSSARPLVKVPQQPGHQKRRKALGEVEINTLSSPKKVRGETTNGPSRRNKVNKRNAKGETPLQLACIRGDTSAVAELLELGADPNACDHAGWTPLHEACFFGHLKCVTELIKLGVTLETPSEGDTNAVWLLSCANDGTTPLHDAVNKGHVQIVKLLVKSGGKELLDVRSRNGPTPGDMAVTDEMKMALKTLETNIPEEANGFDKSIQPPQAAEYREILGDTAVPLETCKVYSLLLAHELRACLQSKVTAMGMLSNEDIAIVKMMHEKVLAFSSHLKQLMKVSDLSNSLLINLQCMETAFEVC